MQLKLYYPFSPQFFFTIVVPGHRSKVYWKASQIFKVLRLNKPVHKVYEKFLPRHKIKRPAKLFSCMSVKQIKKLLRKVPNPIFEKWFHNVMDGHQVLRVKISSMLDAIKFRGILEATTAVTTGLPVLDDSWKEIKFRELVHCMKERSIY